eukprot:9584942-Prorocentrum_lima.AAC.1
MTSSLVGSEMCIRDRYVHWDLAAGVLRLHSAKTSLAHYEGLGENLLHFCLLYTSDAADDM